MPEGPLLDKVVQSELMTSDGWWWRRLLVFSVAWFLCGLIVVVSLHPAATTLAPMVLSYSYPALMAIVMAYVFGAVWDDRDKRLHAARLGGSQAPSQGDSPDDTPDTSDPCH